MGEFISEFLLDLLVAPLVNFLLKVLWLVGRPVGLVVLYPIGLLTGWLRLWLRRPRQRSLGALWRTYGLGGLHRFGWQQVALDLHFLLTKVLALLHYLLATVLLLLGGAGLGLVIYFTVRHLLL